MGTKMHKLTLTVFAIELQSIAHLEFPTELPIFTGEHALIGINDTQRAV